MKRLVTDLKDLSKIAQEVEKKLRGGEILALQGNLGAGKTTFTKYLLKAAGIKKNVTSPTFSLMIPYKNGPRTFYHLDLYRLKGYADIKALGIEQLWLKKENIFIIEWPEKIRKYLPKQALIIKFKVQKNNRTLEFSKTFKQIAARH